MHEIILILNYDEDVNKEKLDQVIGEQVYSNYNRLYTNTGKNNLHDFIKQIMINVVGDTLVFPDFILTQEDLQALYTVMSGEYTVNIIQFINNWDKDKLTAKEYNDSVFYAAQYCDSIYLVNETTGFYKNYSDHLLEARYLLDILSNNLKHNSRVHDSDKLFDKDINECYEKYYPELKKMPYYDKDGNRNKEYLDYEEKYMREAMSKHVIINSHHYYDWKNSNSATLLDLLEAVIDVYSSIIINTEEPLELERFIDIVKKKGMLIDIEDMIANTIRELGYITNETFFFRYNRSKHIEKRVIDNDDYKHLRGKEALDWIKAKNDYYYENFVKNYISNIQLITFTFFNEKTGMFVNEDLKSMNFYFDLYYNEDENDIKLFATPIDDSLDRILI